MKIKAGYKIEVTSWENDGDNYSTKSKEGLTKEQTQLYFDICNLLDEFGNMYEPDNSETDALYVEVSDILLKHKTTVLELFEHVDFDDLNYETCEGVFFEIHHELFGGSDFYTRKLQTLTVTYIPHDIELKDVTHEFM